MTNKEKKAIEYWKRDISLYHYNTQLCSEHYAQIILNLIEKQSKEIEELKGAKYLYNAHTGEIIKLDNSNYISKDKIKEKIEEYNKMINATYADLTYYADYRRDVYHEIKNVLQVLLEEE